MMKRDEVITRISKPNEMMSTTRRGKIARLPKSVRTFIARQEWDRKTDREHAEDSKHEQKDQLRRPFARFMGQVAGQPLTTIRPHFLHTRCLPLDD